MKKETTKQTNQGFIKLHRKILEWEWYNDLNTFKLFVHCLLKANYIDKKWKGKEIKRGSFVSGRIELSKETGISQQSIRTSITKLKSTSNLTIKSTNEQPTTNQQLTTTNKDKKGKEYKEEYTKLVGWWNKLAKEKKLSQIVKLSDARRKQFNARLLEAKDFITFRKAIELNLENPYMTGSNDRNWKADLDYYLNGNKFIKILEKYKTEPTTNNNEQFGKIPTFKEVFENGK